MSYPGAFTLTAGYGEALLDPPLGGSMPGYFTDRKADGVLDPLKAKAVYLESGDTRAVIVAMDLIGFNAPQVEACRAAVEEALGIPPRQVWIHATHTHTGAMVPRHFTSDAEQIVPDVYVGTVDDAWVATIPGRVVEAIRAARANARPGPTELAETTAPNLAFYRRFKMKDGTVRTNPGRNNPEVVEPAGHVDPAVTVLRFPASKTLVVIFGLHPDVIGGTKYSADYPHHLTKRIREDLGADWGVLFLNAACGNINHIDVDNPKQGRGYDESRRIGRALGDAVLASLGNAKELEIDVFGVGMNTVASPIRTVPEETVRQAERILKEQPEKARDFNGLFAPAALVLGRTRDREQTAEVSAMRIGPVGLVGMPGEYFVELARQIQHDSPLEPTRVIGLTNGSLGYIPHEAAYQEGGYESGYRSARFRPGTGEAWARSAIRQLRGMVP
jgi:hypothetical protein